MATNSTVNSTIVNHWFGKWTRRAIYFCFSLMLPLLLIQASQAASSSNGSGATSRELSLPAILSIIAGIIISVFYIRGMYLVLHYASETYSADFDINTDAKLGRSTASKILIFGSAMLVVVSALIISSYGWGWVFLYVGPILCLLGPIVVIVSMALDVRKYKQVLREQALQTLPSADDRMFTR